MLLTVQGPNWCLIWRHFRADLIRPRTVQNSTRSNFAVSQWCFVQIHLRIIMRSHDYVQRRLIFRHHIILPPVLLYSTMQCVYGMLRKQLQSSLCYGCLLRAFLQHLSCGIGLAVEPPSVAPAARYVRYRPSSNFSDVKQIAGVRI